MLQWLGDSAEGLWNWTVIGVFLALAGWETMRPWRPAQGGPAWRWLTNIGLYAANTSLLAIFVPAAVADAIATHVGLTWRPVTAFGQAAGDGWALVVGLLILDFYAYAIHRAEHSSFVFWRFHAVHHSDIEMDASTTLRHHPLEVLASSLIGGVLFGFLGIPEWVFPVYALGGITISLIQHANAELPPRLDRALQWVLVTPALHQIHHSVDEADYNANYGTVLSVWDRLFGTLRRQPVAGLQGLAFGVRPFASRAHVGMRWAWVLPFMMRRDAPERVADGSVR